MGGHEPRQSTDHDCLDHVFVALSHRVRRRVLARLHERSPRDVEDLVARNRSAEPSHVDLYHRHLPKLDDLGFVEWDGESEGTIHRGPKFDAVAPVIEFMEAHESDLPGEWP